MKAILALIACLCIGTGLGLTATYLSVWRAESIGAVRVGAWMAWADSGTPNMNPYERARFAVTGQIPMPAGIGMLFFANADTKGGRLQRNCSYLLAGPVPQAGFWTLEAAGKDGSSIRNAAQRSGFTSDDVLREDGGGFTIAMSRLARPGNWLPLAGRGPFILVLRLYDTPLTAYSGRELRSLSLPAITLDRCT